ncbi:MAG: hypothetical protein K5694_00080 [Bacilli bacterium]|nr:hypothetical protein [Bacilli bacterium]
MEDSKHIIIVAGVTGAGKTTFAEAYKNSFLHSYPEFTLLDGVKQGVSFFTKQNLTTLSQLRLIQEAHNLGYRITVYYLFTGKLLSDARSKLRQIAVGQAYDEELFKSTYEDSYKGLMEIYPLLESCFFVKNQKNFEFLAAYRYPSVDITTFKNAVKAAKNSVDKLR